MNGIVDANQVTMQISSERILHTVRGPEHLLDSSSSIGRTDEDQGVKDTRLISSDLFEPNASPTGFSFDNRLERTELSGATCRR